MTRLTKKKTNAICSKWRWFGNKRAAFFKIQPKIECAKLARNQGIKKKHKCEANRMHATEVKLQLPLSVSGVRRGIAAGPRRFVSFGSLCGCARLVCWRVRWLFAHVSRECVWRAFKIWLMTCGGGWIMGRSSIRARSTTIQMNIHRVAHDSCWSLAWPHSMLEQWYWFQPCDILHQSPDFHLKLNNLVVD